MSNGLLAMGQLSFSERLRQARALDALLETFSDDEDDDADAWSFRPPEVPRATVAVAAAIADRSSNSSSPSAAAALRASAAAIAGRRRRRTRRRAAWRSPRRRRAPRRAAALAAPAAPRRCSSCGALPPATRSLPAISGATYAATLEEPGSRLLRTEQRRRQVAEPEGPSPTFLY